MKWNFIVVAIFVLILIYVFSFAFSDVQPGFDNDLRSEIWAIGSCDHYINHTAENTTEQQTHLVTHTHTACTFHSWWAVVLINCMSNCAHHVLCIHVNIHVHIVHAEVLAQFYATNCLAQNNYKFEQNQSQNMYGCQHLVHKNIYIIVQL